MSEDEAKALDEKLAETEAILAPLGSGFTEDGQIVTFYRPAPLFPATKANNG